MQMSQAQWMRTWAAARALPAVMTLTTSAAPRRRRSALASGEATDITLQTSLCHICVHQYYALSSVIAVAPITLSLVDLVVMMVVPNEIELTIPPTMNHWRSWLLSSPKEQILSWTGFLSQSLTQNKNIVKICILLKRCTFCFRVHPYGRSVEMSVSRAPLLVLVRRRVAPTYPAVGSTRPRSSRPPPTGPPPYIPSLYHSCSRPMSEFVG